MLSVSSSIRDNTQTIKCVGKLDLENSEVFDTYFVEHHDATKDVVVDLNELSYISSIGLRSLIKVAKSVQVNHKKIYLSVGPGNVREIIKLSGFVKIMPFIEN